jgi:hypothetical protein
LSLCLTNEALHDEGVWGSGYIDPHFLDLGTGWRCGQLYAPAALPPEIEPPVPIEEEAG